MTRLAVVTGGVVVVALLAGDASWATPIQSGGAAHCRNGVCVSARENGPDGSTDPVRVETLDRSPFYWERKPFDFLTNRSCPTSPDGVGWFDYLKDSRDGSVVSSELGCLQAGEAEPDLPALPPSPAEVFDRAPIPAPVVTLSPLNAFEDHDGLVGFEAWLWYEGPTAVSVDAAVPGFAVAATVEVVSLAWDMGNGDTVTADDGAPGGRDDPAATYVYENSCDCVVTLTVTWGGTYTVTTGGGEDLTLPLGTRDYAGSRPYPVAEVEAVVTDN